MKQLSCMVDFVLTLNIRSQRAMATGIVFCGSALGTLIVAPLYEVASTYLTWRQTLRVMSAFSFMSILCVLTYRYYAY